VEPLLYLTHRIPYPPNKGDKIRSYHLLRYLAQHFNVYLGTFIDEPEDWQYAENLQKYCKEVFIRGINPRTAKIRSLRGLISGEALSLPYYKNQEMQSWVSDTTEKHAISKTVIFSSAMAQFLLDKKFKKLRRVIDFVDMDSDKWMQYSASKSWPMSWLYKRESRYLLHYEKIVTTTFEKSLFVSHAEAELFKTSLSTDIDKVDYYNNGVDSEYFSPGNELIDPYKSTTGPVIVFTGAMDYWANADAALWFINNVFMLIQNELPNVKFYIVGSKPTVEVMKLNAQDNITVTGFVDDVRPYILYSDIVVAPLQIARGVQNKVLEAMALEKNIVATTAAIEGIELITGYTPAIADEPNDFARACIEGLNSQHKNISIARDCVLENYNWEKNLNKLSVFI